MTDVLGRMTAVYEDPTSLNYVTSYSYDVLDNLTTVSQGVQTRTFVYDSLSRLTSTINPENSTVTYSYDNNGNLTNKFDARSITATLADALNRVISARPCCKQNRFTQKTQTECPTCFSLSSRLLSLKQ